MNKKLHINKILLFFILTIIPMESFSRPVAYPVPFNPRSGSVKYLTVKFDSAPADIDRVEIHIYDINGDVVITKNYTGAPPVFPVIWNGRNARGSLVKPGLYILKVIYESSTSEVYGKKTIRILVQY